MEQLEGSVTISLRDYHRFLADKAEVDAAWDKLDEVRKVVSQFINIIHNSHDISEQISEFNRISKYAKVVHTDNNKIMIKIIKDGNEEVKGTDK